MGRCVGGYCLYLETNDRGAGADVVVVVVASDTVGVVAFPNCLYIV